MANDSLHIELLKQELRERMNPVATFEQWVAIGKANGWATSPVCLTHEPPSELSHEEDDCQHVLVLTEQERYRHE